MDNLKREQELQRLSWNLMRHVKELRRKYYYSESISVAQYLDEWATVIEICHLANRHIERILRNDENRKEWFDIARKVERLAQYGRLRPDDS